MAAVQRITVPNAEGLHARPAAMLVQRAQGFASAIRLEARNQSVDAKSILSVLRLAIRQGETVTIRAEGVDEAEAVTVLAQLVASQGPAQ